MEPCSDARRPPCASSASSAFSASGGCLRRRRRHSRSASASSTATTTAPTMPPTMAATGDDSLAAGGATRPNDCKGTPTLGAACQRRCVSRQGHLCTVSTDGHCRSQPPTGNTNVGFHEIARFSVQFACTCSSNLSHLQNRLKLSVLFFRETFRICQGPDCAWVARIQSVLVLT